MNYLLNQEEYNKLQLDAARGRELPTDKELQQLCTKICDEMPVVWEGWGKDRPVKPWGCIITQQGQEWYCDNCPVQTICPHRGKEYSK